MPIHRFTDRTSSDIMNQYYIRSVFGATYKLDMFVSKSTLCRPYFCQVCGLRYDYLSSLLCQADVGLPLVVELPEISPNDVVLLGKNLNPISE